MYLYKIIGNAHNATVHIIETRELSEEGRTQRKRSASTQG